MNTTNLLKIALRALANNKLRGFLTMLGIIIGVASVITMLAIGQGSKRSIQAQISEMGSNMIMIQPGADMRGGVRQDASAMETLKLQDYEDIVNETRYVSATSPSVNSSGQAIYGANNAPTTVYGISPDYMEIRRYEVEDGDMFSDQDVQTAAKVCVIGKTVVDNLFPGGENPVGRVIRFQKLPFRVVGVLKSKGYNSMGMDQDDLILAPYTTIQKKILAITHLQGITCSALKEEYTDQAIDEISEILRRNHRLRETDDDDFTIRSMQELSTMLTSTTDIMTTLLAAVAGISLLVGGIGIMNIMYVSVTERTREIGLRMSIGAKGMDILAQFLIESILISVTGGLIGVLFAVQAALDLHGDPLLGDALLALLKALADAHNGNQAVFQRGQDFRVHILVRLAHGAALRVAEDDVLTARVHEHVCGDLAGIGAGSVGVAVLRANADSRLAHRAHSGGDAHGRHAQRHIAPAALGHDSLELVHELLRLRRCLIHLPVASDHGLAIFPIHGINLLYISIFINFKFRGYKFAAGRTGSSAPTKR